MLWTTEQRIREMKSKMKPHQKKKWSILAETKENPQHGNAWLKLLFSEGKEGKINIQN